MDRRIILVLLVCLQVQAELSSLEGEPLEVLKRELITIKDIFVEKDSGKEDEAEENGDLYSIFECPTCFCKSRPSNLKCPTIPTMQ